mmetsp:Transcript_81207/g.118926  ORF Transcript_81207/g.118926 Transcript_81207/m.118926 type:complete len:131 (+) Transcript_81207:21-413(+)
MYFIIPFVVLAGPCAGGAATYHYAHVASRRRLENQLGREIAAKKGAMFMSGVMGAFVFASGRMLISRLPVFKDGGRWASAGSVTSWADLWRTSGPRSMGSFACLITSLAFAGAVRPHFDAGEVERRELTS